MGLVLYIKLDVVYTLKVKLKNSQYLFLQEKKTNNLFINNENCYANIIFDFFYKTQKNIDT